MLENRKQNILKDFHAVKKKLACTLRVLEKFAEGEEESDFGELYADLVGLLHSLRLRQDEEEILTTFHSICKSFTSKLSVFLDHCSRYPRVRVSRVNESSSSSQPPLSTVIGVEMAPPQVGEKYLLLREKGRFYFTSCVTKISGKYIHTRNSIYHIEILSHENDPKGTTPAPA